MATAGNEIDSPWFRITALSKCSAMRGMVAHGEELANSNWQGHQVNLVKATEFVGIVAAKAAPTKAAPTTRS